MPSRIIYRSTNDVTPFDFERFKQSLQRYDSNITSERIEEALEEFEMYDPLHVSCLVEVGVKTIADDAQAEKYYWDHVDWFHTTRNFERLRRITGYLVGSLERWNDGKKAEEHDRVKHGVYSQENKDYLESEKLEYSQMAQF